MVVNPSYGLVPLTAAQTDKLVVVTGVIAPEVFLLCNLFSVTKATDGVVKMIVNAMSAVVLTATRQADQFTLNLLVKLLVILPQCWPFLSF